MNKEIPAQILVSRVHAACTLLFLVPAITAFSLIANQSPYSAYPNIGHLLVAAISAPMACIHGLISIGAKLGMKWARILSILVACVLLFLFPIGTIIGIILISYSLEPWKKTGIISLILNSAQQSSIIDNSEPAQISELLQIAAPEAWGQLSLQDRYDFITRHIPVAEDFGIKTTHEKSTYCALALMYGEDFASQPVWKNGLAHVQAGTLTLTKLVEEIDKSE